MFKSAFSKYLTAFIIIILLSFLMLSGIITSMIRTYVSEEKEASLVKTASVVSKSIEKADVEDLAVHVSSRRVSLTIKPIINNDSALDVIVIDENGKILLTTLGTSGAEDRNPVISDSLGVIDINSFVLKKNESSTAYLSYRGTLGGYLSSQSLVCAKEIVTYDTLRGYVLALNPTTPAPLINITNKAVLTSSALVMLAAVIAVYFITERIIHPLRSMTTASKKFAKGDFSVRVNVTGEDEVAELGNAFNNMAESLEKLDKMRSSFLASVSHDLRTPMTTISGFIEGINSGAIPPEKHEYYLGVISKEVHRLSRLVSQLLDVSRLESGDRKFNFTNFDVAEVARIILISFEQKIDEKKLDVEFFAENDEMYAFADKDAIHQVIYNLCHNAIKFSSVGGKFRISLERIENKKIMVSVFDEGEIISKEDGNMIFDRFYKTDKSRGLDKTGVGLGLYITKTIIDAHEEEITVKSEESFGTEFTFTLKEGESIKKKPFGQEI